MIRFVSFVIATLVFPTFASAQHIGHGASGLAHGIPDFCATATERLVVPAGQSRTLSGRFETSCLGVHGTVVIASDTTVRVDELLIYEDGALIVGTADQPATGVEIIIRDRPLDLTGDPEQFGQGVIGLGKFALRGQSTTGATRSIVIRSENPLGTRGHVILTQRADVDVRYVAFVDLGRTRAADPLDSTTFSGDIATHTGTNQIGRYALHLHHVMGPAGGGRPYQFQLIGNLFLRGEKWGGITLHNSHFGLIQNNECRQATAVCYVEEDGSETANEWIGNYAGQATGAKCNVSQYDPEARCPAGFWLRGANQVLKNNVIEDIQRGISWWTLCLEMSGPPCGGDVRVTIPKAPGADTTDSAQIRSDCAGRDGSPAPCAVWHRTPLTVDGNIIRRAEVGLEPWWLGRKQHGGGPITNTTTVDVVTPVLLHYSDVQIDGLTATGCQVLVGQFNDASTIGFGSVESVISRATATCSDAIYLRTGQLHQAPAWRFSNSTLNSPNGLRILLGGQRVVGYPVSTVKVENSSLSGAIFTTGTQSFECCDPAQRIVMTATSVNGRSFTQVLPEGASTDAPATPTQQPNPGSQPTMTTPAIETKPCRFPPELGICR